MIVLTVNVKLKSFKEELFVNEKDALVYRTNKFPEKNSVNIALVKLISKIFKIPISLIAIDPKTFKWTQKKLLIDIPHCEQLEIQKKLTSLKKIDSLF